MGEESSILKLGPVTARYNGDTFERWVLNDHLGSAVASINGPTGAYEGGENFTPFGEARYNPYLNWDKPSFTGHVADSATGLTYMQARFYDPVIGRFLSTDPIDYADQLNLYAYVGQDPMNFVDTDGLIVETVWDLGNVAFDLGRAIVNLAEGDKEAFREDTQNLVLGAVAVCTPGVPAGAGRAKSLVKQYSGCGRPALKGDPYSPSEVSKRQSQTRQDLGMDNLDPETPIPDQKSGRNIKSQLPSRSKGGHDTGERNVNRHEEHSRVPKRPKRGR